MEFPHLSMLSYPLRLARLIPKSYDSLEAERKALLGDFPILHHLYGEDTLLLSGWSRFKKDKRIVSTFHQPSAKFIEIMPFYWKRVLKNIDGIIVLSPSQFRFFGSNLDHPRLFLIPHGIDIDYFSPAERKEHDDMFCLSVGDYLRDYETLVRAVQLARRDVPQLRLVIVSRRFREGRMRDLTVKNGVSDEELLGLYKSAAFMVLPLESATANNVLLEGLACGVPTIAARLEDVVFYGGEDGCLYYEKGNAFQLARQIVGLVDSSDLRNRLSIVARKRAEMFSWKNIVKKTVDVYEACCKA
jgi:glycosyltransferase involved in cell wall biosynthesis